MTGAELRARRRRLGLTQEALAEAFGTTQNTVSRWETGRRRIVLPKQMTLALEGLAAQLRGGPVAGADHVTCATDAESPAPHQESAP